MHWLRLMRSNTQRYKVKRKWWIFFPLSWLTHFCFICPANLFYWLLEAFPNIRTSAHLSPCALVCFSHMWKMLLDFWIQPCWIYAKINRINSHLIMCNFPWSCVTELKKIKKINKKTCLWEAKQNASMNFPESTGFWQQFRTRRCFRVPSVSFCFMRNALWRTAWKLITAIKSSLVSAILIWKTTGIKW